jgi:hypothetical protein
LKKLLNCHSRSLVKSIILGGWMAMNNTGSNKLLHVPVVTQLWDNMIEMMKVSIK